MLLRQPITNTSPLPGTTGADPGLHLRRTAFPDLVRLDTPGLGVPADSSEALIPLPSEPSDYPSGSVPGSVPSSGDQHRVRRRSIRQSRAVQLSSVGRCLPYGRRVVAALLARSHTWGLCSGDAIPTGSTPAQRFGQNGRKSAPGPKMGGGAKFEGFWGTPHDGPDSSRSIMQPS
jgi:hypothetical protein